MTGPPPEWFRRLEKFRLTAAGSFERVHAQLLSSDLMTQWHKAADRVVNDIIPRLAPAFEKARKLAEQVLEEALAPNWYELPLPDAFDVMELMAETGWGLSWSPPSSVLVELLAAPDLEAKRRVLVRSEGIIVADLRRVLRDVDHDRLEELATAAEQALEAYASGFYWPSQALSSAAITTAIHEVYAHRTFPSAREAFKELDLDEAGIHELRLVTVQAAVRRTIEMYFPGDPIPDSFNRHASTHYVGAPQYGQLNALTGLMLLVSLLRETQSALELLERLRSEENGD